MTDTTLPSPRNNLNPFAGLMSGTVGPVKVVARCSGSNWPVDTFHLDRPCIGARISDTWVLIGKG